MIRNMLEAASNQAKERISGEMLASLRGNDRHGNPRLENLKSFQGEGYCRIDVYEKATGISRWLLGFVALRELLQAGQRFQGARWSVVFFLCISWLHGEESHGDEYPYPNRRP